ncbi:MAG: rhodanese-like domain-containing protein [Anaerolineales bacterium]
MFAFTDTIPAEKLSANLNNPEFVLVDIRPSAAYNGWRLRDEARGGHIRGAVSFPVSWVKDLSTPELKTLLQSKGVLSEKTVVLYGYHGDDCSTLAGLLRDFSQQRIFVYEAGIQEWAADPSLPMDHLANYQHLVYPEWVQRYISEGNPGLFEVSHEGFEAYQAGHIPGAVQFDLASIECEPNWNICSNGELLKLLLSLGITHKSLIVLYGRNTMAAARAANVLMYAGVEDVRLLDGGIDAWTKAGHPLESGVQQPVPVEAFGRNIPAHPEYILDMDGAKALLADDQGLLVSVRSWDEYIGKTSGYDYIQARGHIAGAVWGYSGSDPHQLQDYRNPDHSMRSYHEIESNWQRAGITPDKKVAFYCGTGWRASEAFFYAYLMGRQHIAVYDGGWLEWSRDGSNPIEGGVPNLPDR